MPTRRSNIDTTNYEDTTIHALFLDHPTLDVVDDSSTSCPDCEIEPPSTALSGIQVFARFSDEDVVSISMLVAFRRNMSSLRFHHIYIHRGDTEEDRYLRPILDVFQLKPVRRWNKWFRVWYEVGTNRRSATGMDITANATIWYSNRKVNTRNSKQALMSVIFVPPQSVCWKDMSSSKPFSCTKNHPLLRLAVSKQSSTKSLKYVVITNEKYVAVFRLKPHPRVPNGFEASYSFFSLSSSISLRSVIGCTLEKSIPNFSIRRYQRSPDPFPHGAARRDAKIVDEPRRFRDFDLMTLQRRQETVHDFLKWKSKAEKQALSRPLKVNDLLEVHIDAFLNRLGDTVVKFNLPLEKPAQETLGMIMRQPRPRHDQVDDMLEQARSGGNLRFHVESVIKSGLKYSQILKGSLRCISNDGNVSTCGQSLCLKLLDEVLFPIDREDLLEEDVDSNFEFLLRLDPRYHLPGARLRALIFADNMMRREHAVYTRLQYLQGTLLPHCYGFHELMMPDGRTVYGILMEMLEGQTLGSLPELSEWPKPAQRALVRRLRHGVRALRYGGIHQDDWNLHQIIMLKSPVTHEGVVTSDYDSEIEFAFIDFSFTEQRLGSREDPPRVDTYRTGDELGLVLCYQGGVDGDIMDEEWFGPFKMDDWEY